MNDHQKRDKFRALLNGARCVYPASVFDPVSALTAEELGFDVGLLGGSIASMSVLAAPDVYALTLSELAEQVRRISRVGNIPLLVDGDHGYGNALSVMRTIEELAAAGAAAVMIEDTLLPPPFGQSGTDTLTSIEEGAGRMRAAVAASRDSGIVILARTGAAGLSGVADAIARCKAYAATGVDGIFLNGFRSVEDFKAITETIDLPLVVDPTIKEVRNIDLLNAAGVKIALQGHQAFTAAAIAIYDVLKALRDGADPTDVVDPRSAETIKRINRAALYTNHAKAFMGRD
ncbi:isocitrate lyase/PEP mutase family protein [Brucella intermedia]|uniref:isocitrate lyase/PEP mutase family protein n=1 Tax=Brucella intermedia TaxID=94625 RepID=UPI00224A7ACE|nr:isocitrate lyase/phosphoenolpyruvate mutase family protein [Brucella intermedia]